MAGEINFSGQEIIEALQVMMKDDPLLTQRVFNVALKRRLDKATEELEKLRAEKASAGESPKSA